MRYYIPPKTTIDLSSHDDYVAPSYHQVDFVLPYAAPAASDINLQSPSGYIAPVYTAVNFGDVPVPAVEINVEITAPASVVTLQLAWGVEVPASTSTNLERCMGWRKSRFFTPGTQLAWNKNIARDPVTDGRWQQPKVLQGNITSSYEKRPAKDSGPVMWWGAMGTLSRQLNLPAYEMTATDLVRPVPWGNFNLIANDTTVLAFKYPPPVDRYRDSAWFSVDLFAAPLDWQPTVPPVPPDPIAQPVPAGNYAPPDAGHVDLTAGRETLPDWHYNVEWTDHGRFRVYDYIVLNFGALEWAPKVEPPVPERPNVANIPRDSGGQMVTATATGLDDELTINWGAGSWTRPVPDYTTGGSWDVEPEEPAARPPQPQILGTYIFMPTCKLYRTSDGAEIQAINVNWSTNIESWGWQFSATLLRDSDLTLLKPDSNGPHEITCEINGHTFTGMVESYAPTRRFGEAAFTIKGRSLSAWLADPYALKRSKAITARYSAAALAGQEVENTGWTIDWQAPDWIVAAGAWSYENLAPISAIKRLADAIGACIRTEPDAQTLTVLPRYPVSPHLWSDASTTLDAILPAAMVTEYSGNFVKKPNFNRSIVTGGSTGGVIVTLTRYGTAGDIPTDMIQNDLITDSDAGQERGRIEIAQGGAWQTMNLTGWLTESGEAPGLLLPGYLVEYQDADGASFPVQVSSTQISASQQNDGALSVRQTLGAERYLADVQY